MWFAEHRLETTASPGAIWQRWADVATWPDWNDALLWARLEGQPAKDTTGTLKLRQGTHLRVKVLKAIPAQRWVLEGRTLGLTLCFDFRVEATQLGSRVIHRVEGRGPLAWLWGFRGIERIRQGLPKAARALARLAGRRGTP